MDLIRKHLMIEGHIEKECLVRILQEVTDVYRKSKTFICYAIITTTKTMSDLAKNFFARIVRVFSTLGEANSLALIHCSSLQTLHLCNRQRSEHVTRAGTSDHHW